MEKKKKKARHACDNTTKDYLKVKLLTGSILESNLGSLKRFFFHCFVFPFWEQ
jgi:hypothetical protein